MRMKGKRRKSRKVNRSLEETSATKEESLLPISLSQSIPPFISLLLNFMLSTSHSESFSWANLGTLLFNVTHKEIRNRHFSLHTKKRLNTLKTLKQ